MQLETHIVMKIFVKAKVGARHEKVTPIDNTHFEISVRARPVEGQANEAIIKLLAELFNISSSKIQLTFGHKSRDKIFEITRQGCPLPKGHPCQN